MAESGSGLRHLDVVCCRRAGTPPMIAVDR
jgi:hypothetical protein